MAGWPGTAALVRRRERPGGGVIEEYKWTEDRSQVRVGNERLHVEPIADPVTIYTALDAAELLHRLRFGRWLHRLPPRWLQLRLARQRGDDTRQAQLTTRARLGRLDGFPGEPQPSCRRPHDRFTGTVSACNTFRGRLCFIPCDALYQEPFSASWPSRSKRRKIYSKRSFRSS